MKRFLSSFLPYRVLMDFLLKGSLRSVKAKKNIAWTLVIKIVSFSIQFLIVPISLSYVNPDSYGLWLTLSSVIAWFALLDIGLSNGLRNKMAEAIARNNFLGVRIYVSTTYALLFIIISTAALLFFTISVFVNWSVVLNAPIIMKSELLVLAFIVFGFYAIQFVLKTITVVVVADQKPAIAELLLMLGQLLALITVVVMSYFFQGSLISLGVAMGAAPVVVFFIGSAVLFRGPYKQFSPSLKYVKLFYAKDLFSIGVKFLLLQVAYMGIFQTNNIIIAQVCTPMDVTIYTIAMKYVGTILIGSAVFISPLWTAFTEAYTLHDYAWMKGTFRKMNLFAIFPVISAIVLVGSSGYVYNIWIGTAVLIPFEVTLLMGVYTVLQFLVSLYTSVLNGVSKVGLQLIVYLFSVSLHIPLAIYLTKTMGIIGVLLSASIFMVMIAGISFVQVRKIINKKEKGIWDK